LFTIPAKIVITHTKVSCLVMLHAFIVKMKDLNGMISAEACGIVADGKKYREEVDPECRPTG
jgi:hypothetical protein